MLLVRTCFILVVQAQVVGASSSQMGAGFEGKRYHFKTVCVLKNKRGAKIPSQFSLSEYGSSSCTFHMSGPFGGILTLNSMGSRLDFYDSDMQDAAYSEADASVADVKKWLGNSRCL